MTALLPRVLAWSLLAWPLAAAPKILIVADEFPAMQALASRVREATQVESEIVEQTKIPPDIQSRPAVIVYIHQKIGEPAELRFIDYARAGGKLILLHHSISSGKRPNQYWFPFLGIQLPEGDVAAGGYKYYEGVELEYVNLAPGEYVTTKGIVYNRQVEYNGKKLPGFELADTEVYLNHIFTTPKHVLFGIKYTDKAGKVYMQDRGGWYEHTGKGWVFYFMAGHSIKDFENPFYAQAVINALVWQPKE